MEFKDYYATLGVPREATADDIRKAFRKLARKYHPDVSKEPDAAARMSEINEANTVLSDPERRAAYDALGQGRRPGEEFRPPPGWDEGFEYSTHGPGGAESADFSDFFAELFGRMGASPTGPARGRRGAYARAANGAGSAADAAAFAMRGEDHHARIVLDLADAYLGGQRQITLRSPRLGADGRVTLDHRTLDVQIPKGVHDGQLIRLAGQGMPGHGGAPAGDLFLEVQIRPHPGFGVDGRDVIAELPVAPWEAALGAVLPVSLPSGDALKVRIPAGAQSGRRLTVRGHGIPGKPPGDLELNLRVVLPPADTPRARELYETMARELAFDPRAAAAAAAAQGA